MTYDRNLTALHKGLTPIHSDQDRTNFAPKLAGGIRLLLEDGLSYLTFNNLYDTAYDSSEEGTALGRNDIPELDGTIWTISDIQGWWNLTDSSIPNIERGFGDGSFDVTGRLISRDLTITGSIIITDSSAASIAAKSKIVREKLLDSFNLVKRGTWLIINEDNDLQRACFVRLSGKPEVSTVNSRGRIDFSIGLRAPNPTKVEWFPVEPNKGLIPEGFATSDGNAYRNLKTTGGFSYYRNYSVSGPTGEVGVTGSYRNYSNATTDNSSSAAFSVYNYGNTNVPCYIRFVGPLYGPAVIKNTTTGQQIDILYTSELGNQVLAPSPSVSTVQFLDIDTYTREVHKGDYFNGIYSSSSRGSIAPLVDWIYLQPGKNNFYYEDKGASSTTGTVQIYWRSGWDR